MSFQLKKKDLLTYTNNLPIGPLIAIGVNVAIVFHHHFIKPLCVATSVDDLRETKAGGYGAEHSLKPPQT